LVYLKLFFVKLGGKPTSLVLFWNALIIGFFLLPLGINFSTPFFIVSIGLGLVDIFIRKNKSTKIDWIFLCYPFLFVLMAISLYYTEDFNTGLKLLERALPTFFFPILFLYIKEDNEILTKLFSALLAGIILSFTFNLFNAIYESLNWVEGVFTFNSSVSGNHSFMESFNHGGNHFIGQNFSTLVHPSYVALYVLITFIFFQRKLKGKIAIIVFSLLLIYLFFLASRASLVVIVVLMIINVFNVKTAKAKLQRAVLLTILGSIFIVANPRIHTFYERMLDFTEKKNYNYTTSEQSRILIFSTCIQLVAEAPLLGYGIGDANEKLIERYKTLKYLTLNEQRLNAHNQYFQTLLQVGLFGFSLLILPFLAILCRTRNAHILSMLFVLGIFLFFESMLVRYNGIIFYAIVVPFLLRKENVMVW